MEYIHHSTSRGFFVALSKNQIRVYGMHETAPTIVCDSSVMITERCRNRFNKHIL